MKRFVPSTTIPRVLPWALSVALGLVVSMWSLLLLASPLESRRNPPAQVASQNSNQRTKASRPSTTQDSQALQGATADPARGSHEAHPHKAVQQAQNEDRRGKAAGGTMNKPRPRKSVRRYLLLVVSDNGPGKPPLDQADLVRLVSLLLEPSGFRVQSGRPLASDFFPSQVDQARRQAERVGAAAVVWYRTTTRQNGSSELFLHLLDLLTDKTLVRTIKVTGAGDLERAAALKLWALLRASLLEMRADRGVAHIPAPVAALTGGSANREGDREPKNSETEQAPTSRLSFSIGYGAGVFLSGRGLHHGAEIAADVRIAQWRKGLALALGLSMNLPGRLDEGLEDVSLQVHLLPMALNLTLRWDRRTWFLAGALRAGVMVLSASADLPGAQAFRTTKADPTTGLGMEVGWRPTRNAAIVARFTGDALWTGQCFKRGTDTICLDRARFWATVGFRLDI